MNEIRDYDSITGPMTDKERDDRHYNRLSQYLRDRGAHNDAFSDAEYLKRTISALRAEIDRLTAELATCRDAVKKHQQDLYDENEKIVELRAELETNAKMLARQTRLTQETETQLAETNTHFRAAEDKLEKVREWKDQHCHNPTINDMTNLEAILTDESEASDTNLKVTNVEAMRILAESAKSKEGECDCCAEHVRMKGGQR